MILAIVCSSNWLRTNITIFFGHRIPKPKRVTGRIGGERRTAVQAGFRGALKFSAGKADMSFVMNNTGSTATALQSDGRSSMDSEILTVMDVAQFLRVPKSTVYKLARVGELPASKIGKHWRFLRRDIHEWMRSRSQQG